MIEFANLLSGNLSFLAFAVVLFRGIQFARLDPNLGTTIIPPKDVQQGQREYKRQRLTLLASVGLLLLFEFLLEYRIAIVRVSGDWNATRHLALACWIGKSAVTLILARQFSYHRCGEKGWTSMFALAVIISFFSV